MLITGPIGTTPDPPLVDPPLPIRGDDGFTFPEHLRVLFYRKAWGCASSWTESRERSAISTRHRDPRTVCPVVPPELVEGYSVERFPTENSTMQLMCRASAMYR